MALSGVTAGLLLAVGPPVGSGLVAAGLAVRLSGRGHDTTAETSVYTDLRRPYRWSCVVFAVGAIVCGAVRSQVAGPGDVVTTAFALTTFTFSLPWTVFALNYVGRGTLLTTRRIQLGTAYIAVLVLTGVLDTAVVRSALWPYPDLSVVNALIILGVAVFVFGASGLVLLSTYRHSTLTLSHGAVATLPPLELLFALQITSAIGSSLALLTDVLMSVAWLIGAGALVVATTHYDVLTVRPGTGVAGERAAVREIDEAIVTVEQNGELARANTVAFDLFGERLGDEPFADIVGYEPPTLSDREQIECWTEDGRRQFDPRVAELVTDYNEVFGYTVVLIDITDREIRRQRIEVLNRVLRHNTRNSLDVINADAERLADEDRAASILETTDRLERLTADARRIESLLGRTQDERSAVALATVVAAVTTEMADEHPEASVSVELPNLSVRVDDELCRFALRNAVENAIVHNDGAEPRVEVRGTKTDAGVRLIVADDGPGIPDAERAAIDRRSESQLSHGSSLGLWGINWAVQQLGGKLSFRDSDLGGTAVVIELATN